MKKKIIAAISFSLIVFSGLVNAQQSMDDRFNKYKENFVLELWQTYPTWASSVGYHNFDNTLPIPDDATRAHEIGFCMTNMDQLKQFDLNSLSDANKIDYHLIENQLQYSIWSNKELRAFEWDPSMYNVSSLFADILNGNYAPLDERMRSIMAKLARVPDYYNAAKKSIQTPTKEHTDLAIEQNLGGISVFEQDLMEALKKSGLNEIEKKDIAARSKQAVAAIKDYVEWLKKLPSNYHRDFRLGKQLYEKKFGYEIQSGYTAEEIYNKALAHKDELHGKMYDITKELWPKYFASKPIPSDKRVAIKQMIDTLSANHVQPDSFQSAIEHSLPKLIAFIKAKNLIYIDPSKPLVVRREPAYMAGVAGASVNSPGPYDKNGNTYYNVGSLEGWPKEKAESYLREYNHYILQILNIHEAIPGHYTQLVYANQSPSIIKSILGNNAMIEGWAVYTERMMLENGYDVDHDVNSTAASPEMWLMYYKWNLRSTCNTILDYSVHTKNMSKTNALNMLVNEAFQQQAEAEGKWKRVSVTQVQLCCYFTGYTEIYDLRESLKGKQGKNFNLKQFHEKFLSYGSAPVKYIKQLMTN